MQQWEQIATTVSVSTSALAIVTHFLVKISRIIRALLGLIVTVKELGGLMHSHLDIHMKRDTADKQNLEGIMLRLESVEGDVRDLKSWRPTLPRKSVPAQIQTHQE